MRSRCDKCEAYQPIQTVSTKDGATWEKYGRCHRHPPKNKGFSTAERAYFPVVECDDWCIEFLMKG